jgi:hypothetical protein
MAFIVDISTTKLRANDSIIFTTIGGSSAGTYTINVIPSNDIASTFEVKDTSDVVPSSDEWTQAVLRLRNAITLIGGVVSVTSSETVITITFEDAVSNVTPVVSSANGSLLNLVKTINNGTETSFDPILVPNIRVQSISHRLFEYSLYTPLEYPHGNMGDKLETIINFTSADSFSILDFYYGWTDNETNVYPSGGSGLFEINKSLFQDIATGTEQKFTGDTLGINPVAPLQGNKVESITLIDNGGNNYDLNIKHYIPILPRPVDVDTDGTLTKPAEIETSLKFIFQIDLKADLITPNPTETTSKENLTQFISNGNIGYVGQVYQTGQSFYTLDSFVWDNSQNELNGGLLSSAQIVISKTSGFDANHDIVLKIQSITDSFDQSETQLENYNFDSVQVKTDGTPNSSSILQNVVANFIGLSVGISFDVVPGTILSQYAIYVAIGDGTANKGNQNVLAKISTATNDADDSTVVFGTYPTAPRAEYNYNLHYLDNLTDSFNQMKSFVDDFLVSRFRVQNNDVVNNTLQNFVIRIRSGNNVFETFTINADDFNAGVFEIERTFNLLGNDIRKKIIVTDNLDGTYDFIYPFQVTDTIVSADNVIQETIANFEQQTAIGLVPFSNNWISPVFELGNYNQTENSFADPQVTTPPSKIQYFDETGTNEVGVILSEGKTLVVATFEEDNLNDFNADPSAPFTYPDNDPQDNYLTAYFGLNDSNNVSTKYFRFHNLRDNENSPFKSTQGAYYAELERVDVKTAELRAFIEAEDIRREFGEDFDCLKISARLDRIQTNQAPSQGAYSSGYSTGYDI